MQGFDLQFKHSVLGKKLHANIWFETLNDEQILQN